MSNAVSATISQSVQMAGAAFSSVSVAVTGETNSNIETTVASAATDTMTGIGFTIAKLQLVYLLSDQTDCDIVFTDGTHTKTYNLIAGIPQMWFTGNGSNPIAAVGSMGATCTAMTVHNLGTTNGVTNAVASDFHARLIYSA